MGIETNFGNYLGKMDIVSSLATLSYDKRRSEFFTSELITLLILFDNGIINPNNYLGSWAGAFGNFQFMPSTIKNYAIDYNKDKTINLKNIEDFENQLLEKCKSEKPEIIESISSSGKLDEDIEKNLASLINDLKEKFKNA